MAEVIKTHIERFPGGQFIGIKYSADDRDEKIHLAVNGQNGYRTVISMI